MDIKRQEAMVKSVAKNMKAKQRQQVKEDKEYNKMYAIMRKSGKSLDEVTKEDLAEREYKFIVEFITTVMKRPIVLYPNLQE
ncbi:hypothetical protein [Paenibacillus dendritiformis]|uniref:hypothetical protein n=1 Tax=Paenibacillus dendritiformis TaxID=130049 RepID=UPI00387E106C